MEDSAEMKSLIFLVSIDGKLTSHAHSTGTFTDWATRVLPDMSDGESGRLLVSGNLRANF